MHSTTSGSPELDDTPPELNTVETNDSVITNESAVSDDKSAQSQNAANPQFPPPKTDKPRPHVCATCARSFARLEHLKRHERSHTKEKPFECPECTRCFARRDLLLRHQQKLHMTGATSARPRTGRRESVSGASVSGSGRVRKNSIANGLPGPIGASQAQSRRNTIAHVDLGSMGFMDPTTAHINRMHALGLNPMGMGGVGGPVNFDYRGMHNAIGHHGNPQGLPKLDLNAANHADMSDVLHTAPPIGSFAQQTGFDLDSLFSPGTTVNPAQLHSEGPSSTLPLQFSGGLEGFAGQQPPFQDGNDVGWMRNWAMQMQPPQDGHENAIDESSPSRMSSGDTPDDYSEAMDQSQSAIPIPNGDFSWTAPAHPRHSMTGDGTFQLDILGTGLPTLDGMQGYLSPGYMQDQSPNPSMHLGQQAMAPQHLQQASPDAAHHALQAQNSQLFASSLSNVSSDSPSMSSSSMNGSARRSSVTSVSTDSITDATRQSLLNSLSQPSVFGHSHRKFSQPNTSSPLSPGAARNSQQGPNLPSTADIRRYVDAFIHFAHPHMPVAHIPTLTFDKDEGISSVRSSTPQSGSSQASGQGGGGCLILAMAAIGALYEYDHPASKELFEAAKKMIGLYLEERRKADMSAAVSGGRNGNTNVQNTPTWLVHAMLLNVIYGHQCGDKTSMDIASNHCAALVSLARAANLAQPPHKPTGTTGAAHQFGAANTLGNGLMSSSTPDSECDLQGQWLNWKEQEGRKRTVFAIFILSSTLVCAFNQPPTIMNSEITLELPCDEELWNAKTAEEWQELGGEGRAERNAIPFAEALSYLLTANQRQGPDGHANAYNGNNPLGALQAGHSSTSADFKPSTFGCLVLIHALHNYIWETRSRHQGREWTPQETESMFSHIEPALNAWQAAWKANEHHKLERPNPFGLGPLSADSIPLLDLAFVRLFVNLGRAKEAFWRRDFDAMAEELAHGDEIVQHAEGLVEGGRADIKPEPYGTSGQPLQSTEQSSSRRERHLRKAAFYAADSMTIACSFNLTYTDVTAHELPVQSAMCFFDCAQVLAEWVSTLQERVGRYLGILGRDQVDFSQVPAIMLLESEDIELFRKIECICESLEAKRFQQENLLAMDMQHVNPGAMMQNLNNNVSLNACGYGSKVLRVTAMMLEKAVVWPVTHVVAKALETQAVHTDQRCERSCIA
ncbi:hypothetical protein KC345_g7696 [Hortaea werneckii]|nr:hypothetical protein KC345_g7696 [Hortaea werneckii]